MIGVTEKLAQLRAFAADCAQNYGRPASAIRIIAVSKRQPISLLQEAYNAGQRDFGENYVTEAVDKISALAEHKDICWHFIGHLQSNKSRAVAENFQWMHTIDRLRIAERLNQQRPRHAPPMNVCLQVNIDKAGSKAGVAAADAKALANAVGKLPNLKLRGLMCMPDPAGIDLDPRRPFRDCAALLNKLNEDLNLDMDTLSMGMSADMDAAIAEGATQVRIGTAIFGKRPE